MRIEAPQLITITLAPVLLALYTLCGTAQAGSIRHDRCLKEYQQVGAEGAFSCVGEVRSQHKRWPASAVLIAPQWAVTAAHVAAELSLESDRLIFGGQHFGISRRVLHPDFTHDTACLDALLEVSAAGTDIALLQLCRAVDHVLPALRYQGTAEVGRVVTMVGYGMVGDGLRGMEYPPRPERLGGHNVIDKAGGQLGALTVSDRILLCDFDHPDDPQVNRFGSACPVPLEISPTSGDSGGGWFIDDDGEWKLVAICSTSFSPTGNPADHAPARYGDISGGVRIFTANEWIDSVISK